MLLLVNIVELVDVVIKVYGVLVMEIICIYIDGSGINGYVGVVGVGLVLCMNSILMWLKYMGIFVILIVYVVELRGMVFVLEILLEI